MPSSPSFQLGTFSTQGARSFAGLVLNGRVIDLRGPALPAAGFALSAGAGDSMLGLLENWSANLPVLEKLAAALVTGQARELTAASVPVEVLRVHAPVEYPRQIFCSGANYKKHVVQIIVAQTMAETQQMSPAERQAHGVKKMDERAANGTPFFFVKAQSTVIGPNDAIELPADAQQPDWELELGVVIGKRARRVKREAALDYVAGYTVVNDITTRERVNRKPGDMREMGMDWVACKCAPTYLPMGPWLTPAAFIRDPQNLQVTLKLNGDTMQDESTADMIFGVARLIEALSATCVLLPGDLICTGSPAGNGMHYGRFLRDGDLLEGSISGLGVQRNRCVAERS